MKIIIKSINIELSSAIRSYIEQKIGGLEKFAPKRGTKYSSFIYRKSCFRAWVTIGKISHHHKKGKIFQAKVQIRLPGKSIRAEAVENDLEVAINEVKDELQRELKQYIEKKISQRDKREKRIKRYFGFSPLIKFGKRKNRIK